VTINTVLRHLISRKLQFINKPYNKKTLAEAIREVLNGKVSASADMSDGVK